MTFDYIVDTSIMIDGNKHLIRFEDGMTGIGSRKYWIDGRERFWRAVRQSADLTKGNHEIYTMKWRETPWDKVDIIIHEKEVPLLLSEQNAWREPVKVNL